MIEVYHNQKFLDKMSFEYGLGCYPFPKDLVHVATVDTDDLDKAFMLTNHIDYLWWENEEVKFYLDKQRSTSCGDIMVKDNKAYVVAAVGFVEVPLEF